MKSTSVWATTRWVWTGTWLVVVGWAAIVGADYRDSFRKGIQALNRRNWSEAILQFRAAIVENAVDSTERVNISGLDFKYYLPQFYLGVALKNANDCGGALAVWRRTSDEALKRAGESGTLASLRRDCEVIAAASGNRNAAAPAVPAAAEPPPRSGTIATTPDTGGVDSVSASARIGLDRADRNEREVAAIEGELRAVHPSVWQEPDLGPAQASAQRTLQAAHARFDAGTKQASPQLLNEAAELATTAARQYESIQQRATTRRDQLRAETIAQPPPGPADAVPTSLASTVPAPAPIAVLGTPARASSLSFPEASVPARASAPAGLPTAVATVGRAATAGRPPKELLSAAELFFSGRYAEARDVLAAARLSEGGATAQAHLFRAASAHMLFLLGGAKDEALRNEAATQVRLCRQSDPGLRPSSRDFSPLFLDFFASTK